MAEINISIVIPCFNEEEVLPELFRRIHKVCTDITPQFEILFINDGSTDQTWLRLLEYCNHDFRVRAIDLSRNFGHQLALSAGLRYAKGNRILILDADLQDPPELLPEMLTLMDNGADVVYGQRDRREGETLFKKITSKWFYRFLNGLSDIQIPRDVGDFRLISRRVLNIFNQMPERHRYIRGMIAWTGFKQVPIRYSRSSRFAGTTKYPFKKMIKFAFDALASFSVAPLKVSIWIGLITAALAILLLLLTVIAWFADLAVVGWSSIFAAVSFFSSIQLFVIGIFGEYLARIVEFSRGRPLYIVSKMVSKSENGELVDEPAL